MSDISLISAALPSLTVTNADTPVNDPRIDAVSKDFEAVFLTQMMSGMFSGEELTEFFGGGTAGDIYKGLLMNEYGKAIAQSGGIGIAQQIKKELLKLQEMQK